MKNDPGIEALTEAASGTALRRRLLANFGVPALIVIGIAVASVFGSRWFLTDVLLKEALRQEAQFYWSRFDDGRLPPPITYNLNGYLIERDLVDRLPASLRDLPMGFSHLEDTASVSVVHVEEHGRWHLVLIFNGRQAAQLAFYFGALPLIVVLTVIYLLGLRLYHTTGRTIAPIEGLAGRISQIRPSQGEPFDASPWQDESREVASLARSVETLDRRVREFSERERRFTRDASHELRSPLTVIRMSTERLRSQRARSQGLDNAVVDKEIARIRRSVDDMEELVSTFLWLARAQESGDELEAVSVVDALDAALTGVHDRFGDKSVELTRDYQNDLLVRAPPKLLAIVFSNLLRNAYNYTDEGRVSLSIDGRSVTVADTGIGMVEGQVRAAFKPFAGVRQRGGVGVGLTIVKSVIDRFGWQIVIQSEPGVGTRVEITFPQAQVNRLRDDDGPDAM